MIISTFVSIACLVAIYRTGRIFVAAKKRLGEIDRIEDPREALAKLDEMPSAGDLFSFRRVFDLTDWDFDGMVR